MTLFAKFAFDLAIMLLAIARPARRSPRSSAPMVRPIRPRVLPASGPSETSFPASKGASIFPMPKPAVLIQPAGRSWDYFHEVLLHWGGAIVILGTVMLLGLAYLIWDGSELPRGVRGRKSSASRPLSDFRIG